MSSKKRTSANSITDLDPALPSKRKACQPRTFNIGKGLDSSSSSPSLSLSSSTPSRHSYGQPSSSSINITTRSKFKGQDDTVIKCKEEVIEEEEELGPIITKNALMWFRTDLRLKDNKALYEASMRTKVGGKSSFLIGLFIISTEEWLEHDEAPVKIDFWMRNLEQLKRSLDTLSIPLIVKTAQLKSDLVGVVESVVRDLEISHVFWNSSIMIDEQRRDLVVKNALRDIKVRVEESESECIIPPADIKTKNGNPYSVFTPYYNTWCKILESEPYYLELTEPPDNNPPEAKIRYAEYFNSTPPNSYPHALNTDEIMSLYPAGEEAAMDRLEQFLETRAKDYSKGRDIPYQEGTSILSPYLSSGIITTRQCVVAARRANKNKINSGDEGLKSWIKELGWREFYKNILVSFPRVCMNRAFQPKSEKVKWSENEQHFQRWSGGKTGFPIVDADLLIHWRRGETYFMSHLIDGDLASNNGGWQWSASTGTDAQPYFRVFNPLLQSQRFDPNGDYIRKWVPELQSLDNKQIHDPYHSLSTNEFKRLRYPKPMVDHASAKKKYIDEFKRALALD
ncbi:hypothetical protein BGZ76_006507 [Entomortierella beljakovae]|nr:hypothetical protein BGZ76_006507 [Entomortierella beljakovae]